MSRFIDDAFESYRRWVSMHDEGSFPVIRLTLTSRESWYFNGLSIGPAISDTSAATISSAGGGGRTLVVRDEDIYLIEVQPLGTE